MNPRVAANSMVALIFGARLKVLGILPEFFKPAVIPARVRVAKSFLGKQAKLAS